jgi:dienelactone hydrolase
MMKIVFMALLTFSVAQAKITTKAVEYKEGDAVLEGLVAYDDQSKSPRPGIVVIHNWKGISDETKNRIKMLAGLGYTAFAADIYGKGIRPKDPTEAREQATKYKSDIPLLRKRAQAALEALKKQPGVNRNKMAAMGYCFGGSAALELARSGAPLNGVVSFHGGLGADSPADAKNIKGKVLALHGADDPNIPATEVQAFEKEMRDAGVDWQLVAYGNSVHCFTERSAGHDNSKGCAYNEAADKRSWLAMQNFFKEVF